MTIISGQRSQSRKLSSGFGATCAAGACFAREGPGKAAAPARRTARQIRRPLEWRKGETME